MNMLKKGLVSIALLAAAVAAGCGSSSSSSDGGNDGAAGTGAAGAGGDPCGGITLFRLSMGDACYDVVSAKNVTDGCNLGVGDTVANMGVVGAALNVNYTFDQSMATLTVGTSGSLGTGAISCNMATLARENNPTLQSMPACTWHQSDSSMVTMTADYEFDVTVTEAQNQFAGCSAANTPTGGMCMSTWTWHMKRNTAKTAPACN